MNGLLNAQTNLNLMQASQSESAANALKSSTAGKNLERIQQAAQEFESVFIYEMMKPML